jgi:hypothetical protein
MAIVRLSAGLCPNVNPTAMAIVLGRHASGANAPKQRGGYTIG